MDVFVMGLAVHPPASRIADKRLEEMVFDTARAALDDAGVHRSQIDHVTIAGCDELDGRSISSMLLAAPSGALLKDEVKCTDSGLTAFCLGAMKVESEVLDLGLVVSWSKPSTAPVEDVMRMRCEPFFTRPIGINMSIADGLFAQGLAEAYGIDETDATQAVIEACGRAVRNPRGMGRAAPPASQIAASPYLAAPLRKGHQAPITDGAVLGQMAFSQSECAPAGTGRGHRLAQRGIRSRPRSADGAGRLPCRDRGRRRDGGAGKRRRSRSLGARLSDRLARCRVRGRAGP